MKFIYVRNLFFAVIIFGSLTDAFGQGKIGINTTAPAAMLHVADSNVVFTGPDDINFSTPGNPVTGAGTRMMWFPVRAAFRTGGVTGNQWDRNNIGVYSFAAGRDCKASGVYSIALGDEAIASGSWSTAIGPLSIANAHSAVAIGNSNLATQTWAVALGNETRSSAFHSFTAGFNTVAKSFNLFAIGQYNDTTASSTFSWIDTDPLFVIGNGQANNFRSNALTILKNGKVGISTVAPVTKLHITDGSDATY